MEHARENARFHGLSERVCFRLAAGLDAVRAEECDTISIAGMGGETIAGILQAAPWTAKGAHKLLLQPMTMLPQLRQWLWANGYQIFEETVCREGKRFYVILTVQGGGVPQEKPLSACYVSPELLRSKGASDYLQALLRRETNALHGMQTSVKTAPAAIREQEEIVRQIQIAWEMIICHS